jgi:4-amino-4-deoxy-L-arabinose transferase-like glycosyltransferase
VRRVPDLPQDDCATDEPRPCAGRASLALLVGVAILAGFFYFYRLDADQLGLDEAHYASATRNLLRPGNETWLIATPYPGHLYFQKPPLYMWLSAALARAWPDALWPFRAWSALFGVLAVVVTARLGWMLSGRSVIVGALAAVLLVTNHSFLFHHGARDGTMDSGLTLLATLALLLASRTRATTAPPLGIGRFVAIGACCGVMSMFKPFAGLPMVALVATPALFTGVAMSWSGRLARLGAALGVAVLVPAPWYVACAVRYGRAFLDEIVGRNLYGRIVQGQSGNVRDVTYYLEVLSGSSLMALTFPAVGYVVWRVSRGDRRLLPVLVVGAGLPLVFTLSAAKITHYLYPAFPSLCVMIAILLRDVLHRLGERFERRALPARLSGALAAMLLTIAAVDLVQHAATERQFRPAEILATLQPAIDRGEVDVRFDGFPVDVVDWSNKLRLEADDIFWLTMLRDAAISHGPTTVPDNFNAGPPIPRPTLVITNRWASSADSLATLWRFADARLSFEGGQVVAALIHGSGLTSPSVKPTSTSPYIVLADDGHFTNGEFRFTVNPPLPGPATVHVEFASDALTRDMDVRSRCRVDGVRVDRGFAYPTITGRHVAAPIELTDRPAVVSFDIDPATRGRIVRAWLVLDVK